MLRRVPKKYLCCRFGQIARVETAPLLFTPIVVCFCFTIRVATALTVFGVWSIRLGIWHRGRESFRLRVTAWRLIKRAASPRLASWISNLVSYSYDWLSILSYYYVYQYRSVVNVLGGEVKADPSSVFSIWIGKLTGTNRILLHKFKEVHTRCFQDW